MEDIGMGERCENCKFWSVGEDNEEGSVDGGCYRYPPKQLSFDIPYADIGGDHYGWPVTTGYSWCGEFVMRTNVELKISEQHNHQSIDE